MNSEINDGIKTDREKMALVILMAPIECFGETQHESAMLDRAIKADRFKLLQTVTGGHSFEVLMRLWSIDRS